jgi:major membrane immunogen (membrane-anchored lipoprotein)
MKKLLVIGIAASLPLLAAGCGEKATVTVYKQGQYQGKPDKQPWDNDQFKGDRAAWERTVNSRALGQNEYVRISGS